MAQQIAFTAQMEQTKHAVICSTPQQHVVTLRYFMRFVEAPPLFVTNSSRYCALLTLAQLVRDLRAHLLHFGYNDRKNTMWC